MGRGKYLATKDLIPLLFCFVKIMKQYLGNKSKHEHFTMTDHSLKERAEREKEIIDGIIKTLIANLDPDRIILFGSQAKGNSRKGSDFDIAVDAKRPPVRVERKISEEIEKISGLYKVDIVYLKDVDEDFKKIVFKTGRVLYER